MRPDHVELSVVIPVFNEEDGIAACHAEVSKVVSAAASSYEVVYVDDGSSDNSAQMLRDIFLADPEHVVVLRLSRNFGHQPAVTAGMMASRGRAVVIIDADLQDPPSVIPGMMDLWRSGYQVVYGVRRSREGETGFKLATAKLFYRLINSLSEIEIPLDTGDFRLLDRVVVEAFAQMPERQRLLRGMGSWIGFSQIGLPYDRHRRFAGHTKYPLKKMLSLAIDGIVSFSTAPLRLVTFAGFFSALIALIGIVYSLAIRLVTHSWVRGWAISFIGMLFMAGLQMLCIGVLGEYIGRIYTETKQRPLFLIREVLRAPATAIPLEISARLPAEETA